MYSLNKCQMKISHVNQIIENIYRLYINNIPCENLGKNIRYE